MSMPRQSIVKVDLSSKLQRYERGALLATADKLANRMGAEVYQDGKAASLTGYTVKGYFIRAGVDTITIAGTIEGNKTYIDLPESCYLYDGSFTCAVKLCKSGYEQTLVIFDGYIVQTITNNIIDSGNVIPFMETLLKRNCYNLLDNSDFRNPVNQRGQTTYTGNGYSIDRWRAFHATTTHTVTADGIAVSASDTNYNIYQPIDQTNFDPDKTYTAAVCDSDGNVFVWSGKPTTATYAPVCIYYNGSDLLFRIIGAKTWAWAALYEGEYTAETLPPYTPKGYAAELLECQRYYRAINNYTNVLAHYMTATYIRGIVPEKNTMRITEPTVTITSAEYYNAGTWVAITPSGANFAGNSIIVSATVEAGTVGNAVMMRLSGNASADL